MKKFISFQKFVIRTIIIYLHLVFNFLIIFLKLNILLICFHISYEQLMYD